MSAGSYIRFFVGLALSASVLWSYMSGDTAGILSAALSVIFLLLTVAWLAFRF